MAENQVWLPFRCVSCGQSVEFYAIDCGWAKIQCKCDKETAVELSNFCTIKTVRNAGEKAPKVLKVDTKKKVITIG